MTLPPSQSPSRKEQHAEINHLIEDAPQYLDRIRFMIGANRMMAPEISPDGRIHIPGVRRSLAISEYRKLMAVFSRILEAKAILDSQCEWLRLVVSKDDETLPDEDLRYSLTHLQASRRTHNLFYKREDQTASKAYKLRGAFVTMAKMMSEGYTEFVAVSTGNHALGILKAAKILKPKTVTIVVPTTTTTNKLESIQTSIEQLNEQGVKASICPYGEHFDQARNWVLDHLDNPKAEQFSPEAYYIDPYSDPWVIAGQGTIGMEVFEQLAPIVANQPKLKQLVLVTPVGGGGLLAGTSTAFKLSTAWDARFAHLEVSLVGLKLNAMETMYGDAIRVKQQAELNTMLFELLGVQIWEMDDTMMQNGMNYVRDDISAKIEGASGGTLYPIQYQNECMPNEERIVVSVLSGGNVIA